MVVVYYLGVSFNCSPLICIVIIVPLEYISSLTMPTRFNRSIPGELLLCTFVDNFPVSPMGWLWKVGLSVTVVIIQDGYETLKTAEKRIIDLA